jgi:hypothetical protein
MTRIITFNLATHDAPAQFLKWCNKNNFSTKLAVDEASHSGGSLIKQTLKDMLYIETGTLIMAHDGTSYVGWAVVYKFPSCNNIEFQCYVPGHKRRQGIGSKMLAKACELYGRVEIYDISTSNAFFRANGITRGEAITGNRLKKTA